MVAYYKSTEEALYKRYEHFRRKREASGGGEGGGGGGGGRRKSGRHRHRPKKYYHDLTEDMGRSATGSNPYLDMYDGRYRNRHCQKRVFRVSFRDLGWQVRIGVL